MALYCIDNGGNASYFLLRHVAQNAAEKQWRLFMLELSESARKELEAYFADKERGNIRVYLAPGG